MKNIMRPGFITLAMLMVVFSCNNLQKPVEKTNANELMKIEKEYYGMAGDEKVFLYSLKNPNGMEVKITNYGGIVTSVLVPDKDGTIEDIVLGFDSLDGYLGEHPYFGCIVGRYANRIAGGKFELDGKTYELATNNGPNHLHGGNAGFDKKIWNAADLVTTDSVALILEYTSPDGEEGYPGNLDVKVTYVLNNNNELKIFYEAVSDRPTPVNLTNHSYFNLAGAGSGDVLDHILMIDASRYTVVDETLIPTGELRPVENTPMDFSAPKMIGKDIGQVPGGYDHNFVLNNSGEFDKVAEVYHEESGRVLEVFTSEPGLQFYSGNFLDGSVKGKGGVGYQKHYGFCLETQHFPDSPNQPGFPDVILRPGEKYQYQTTYKFSTR